MGSEMTIEEIRNGLKAFVNDNPVQSSKTPPSLGGYITPLRVLIDKYYGDNLNANDVDVPYYIKFDEKDARSLAWHMNRHSFTLFFL